MGWLLGLTLLAPLAAFVGAAGTRLGVWDWHFGYDVLTQTIGFGLSLLGLLAAVVALVMARGALRRSGPVALLALLVALTSFGFYWMERSRAVRSDAKADVTTNIADPPGFGGIILAQRRDSGGTIPRRIAGQQDGCANPGSVPRQVAPETASAALQEAGFTPLGRGVGRADGTHTSFWFGFTHDAAIRIRPGQTDVRVVSREDRDDRGEACRLLNKIVEGLQPTP
ncbi:MAG: DUF1499 domain-containing protein [Brevundimonas sp.]|nr:MAG: DUF1499 domain-containing protein [Brevundimonas sp.]